MTPFTGAIKVPVRWVNQASELVSSPGRDSRDSRSSRLAEPTQKALGTNALCTGSRIFIWFLPHIYPIFTKSFFLIISNYYNTQSIIADNYFYT